MPLQRQPLGGASYSRLHVEQVLDPHVCLAAPVPLRGQLVFGPGHVDAVGRGGHNPVVNGGVRCCVPVVDQLGL